MTREEYVKSLKDGVLASGKRSVLQLLGVKIPWLLSPLVSPIAGYFVGWVLEIFINETEFAAFFVYIDLRTAKQGNRFIEASDRNMEAQKNGTPEEKALAEKELMAAFREFAVLTN